MKKILILVIATLVMAGLVTLFSCGGGGGGSDDGLTSLVIHGPATVDQGSQASYFASAFFGDGTVLDVTGEASWAVTPALYASISPAGLLSTNDLSSGNVLAVSASYTSGSVTKQDTLIVTVSIPEETAMVIKVLDGKGVPVDGVSFLLDGSQTVITGSQLNQGQVFVSFDSGGSYSVQLDPDTLTDPQGGVAWIPLASQISGEIAPISFDNRPFAGGSEALAVPVTYGQITVVTIYLADILVSPADNQWLTDGLDAGNSFRTADTDEFAANPRPVFWWRQDPSLGDTVNFTFQLFEDEDGDIRYPMGVIDASEYAAFAESPAWEVSSQAMFTTVMYSSGGSTWHLGWTYAYAGSPLEIAPPAGEYAWRVIQTNPDRSITRTSKLGAFYTYSGYYYASTEGGSLAMSSPSTLVDHGAVFSFVQSAIASTDVIGTPFDSSDPAGFKQITAAGFASDMAAGSSSVTQFQVLYNADDNGKAVVTAVTDHLGTEYLGILKVQTINKLSPLPTPEPWLQGKEFQLSYFTRDDDLVTFPIPLFGGGVYFAGMLSEPDWEDPEW